MFPFVAAQGLEANRGGERLSAFRPQLPPQAAGNNANLLFGQLPDRR